MVARGIEAPPCCAIPAQTLAKSETVATLQTLEASRSLQIMTGISDCHFLFANLAGNIITH